MAGIRYRAVLARYGGPIESLEEGAIDVFGVVYAQANARLTGDLVAPRTSRLFSDANGSGVHISAIVARHKAISEALERWAYSSIIKSNLRSQFFFHLDPSTNGMAAFPGVSSQSARHLARLEAIERSFVLYWWEKQIDAQFRRTKWPGVSAIWTRPFKGAHAVILFMRSPFGFYSYGSSAGSSFDEACQRALIELIRHEWAIRTWHSKDESDTPSSLFERRALYFSTEDGFGTFMNRVTSKAETKGMPSDLVCDAEIKGPWSRFTTVWRSLYRPPSDRFICADDRYFYW